MNTANSGTTYFSNFDNAAFQPYIKREFNQLNEDECYNQRKDLDNNKKLKYIVTNFSDLIEAKDKLNFYGIAIKDTLIVPAEETDRESFLRYGKTGGILTNPNIKNEYGQLPFPTIPSKYQLAHGNVDVEDSLRNYIEPNKNACNPRDTEYYKRYFYIFDDKQNIETPDALKSVESPAFGPRGGASTRYPIPHVKRN